MNNKKTLLVITTLCLLCGVAAGLRAYRNGHSEPPSPFGPLPSEAQVAWQRMEMNMFCHFGPNTFTGLEWGDGREREALFNPTAMDCNQWVAVARSAGMQGIIITAKHHDGFCLWPNPESNHTVAQSPWLEGRGDVLLSLSEACRAGGLGFGIYISPWDRNAPTYGTPEYNDVFCRTLEHAHTHYGPIFEQWFDGACGEGPNGKRQVYDWNRFNTQVAKHQPQAVTFSDIGPGCRWVGNEQGRAPEECWSRLDTVGFAPGHSPSTDTLGSGNYDGQAWIPAEVDVSIRPGWFWKQAEEPKSVAQLVDIYLNSVGHNALLLLNVPPDTRGLIDPRDSVRLLEFRAALDSIFARNIAPQARIKSTSRWGRGYSAANLVDTDYHTYWAAADNKPKSAIELRWRQPQQVGYVVLQEYIPLGQRVSRFHVEAQIDGQWQQVAEGTTIGYKKIVRLPDVATSALRIVLDRSRALPVLNQIEVY